MIEETQVFEMPVIIDGRLNYDMIPVIIREAYPSYIINDDVQGLNKYQEPVPGLLGEGSFGVVVSCKDRECFYDLRAVKICYKQDFEHTNKEFEIQHHFFGQGVAVQIFSHKRISFYHQSLYLVSMEQMDGSLASVLKEHQGRLNPVEAVRIMEEICDKVRCMHDAKIYHGDLKPSNILYKKKNNSLVYRISDFGSARNKDDTHTGNAGTPLYRLHENEWDLPRDVYALSVTLMELLGADIRKGLHNNIRFQIARLWEEDDVDSELREICRKACSILMEDRYTIQELKSILQDWLARHKDEVMIFEKNEVELFRYASSIEDEDRKLKFLLGSADKGYGRAAYEVSKIYKSDLKTYSSEKVLAELKRSVQLDYKPAMNDYAVMAIKNLGANGPAQELDEMAELLRKAAKDSPQAGYNLAVLIIGGIVEAQSEEEAMMLLKDADEKNYMPAKKMLGFLQDMKEVDRS